MSCDRAPFSCEPGHYLEMDSQHCRPCNPGFFSLGGGIRYEEFITLPAGFSVENADSSMDSQYSSGAAKPEECPKEAGWIVKDGELIYIPTPCVSKLSFSANLVRPGSVEFTYRMPRNNRALSMQVDIRNEQCQSYNDLAKSMFLKYTKKEREPEEERNGEWRKRKIELKSGANVISWIISNNLGYQTSNQPIHFDRIDVLGLAFTRQCTACPPGTSSPAGSAECLPCEPGFFSSKGSAKCGKCPESQYSGYKAEKCIDRPPCRPSDYYPVREPCTNGSSRSVYKKVLPTVCRDDLPSSTKLPPPSPWKPCPKCNPGMEKNKLGVCEFCKKDYFSDGNACARCPVDTVPNYGLQYQNWDIMPPKLTTRCEYISEDVSNTCNIGDSWIPSGDSLISAPSMELGIAFELILSIDEGFWNPLAPKPSKTMKVPVAQVTIVFEMSCGSPSCVLYFIEDVAAGLGAGAKESFYRFLAAFNGTNSKRVWSHTITKNTPARFMVAFLRSGVSSGEDRISDEARIYSINVTNVGHRGGQGGGASECLACPHSTGGETCVPCLAGNYMHETTRMCVSCPTNTIVNASSSRVGVESCVPCGQGLTSKDGVTCSAMGKVQLKSEKEKDAFTYDFSPFVGRSWNISGVRVFSREGSAYYHFFTIALFPPNIKCEEQFDNFDMIGIMDQDKENIEGLACRMTALPTASSNRSKTAYVTPLLLAGRLDAISLNRTHGNASLSDQVLEYDSHDNTSLPLDVFFWFDRISTISGACPHGNQLVVVARCQPNKKQIDMRLPRNCPDGTCDGCLFVVIMETAQACPVCEAMDYETINGECVNGKQTIHSIPKKHCVITGAASQTKQVACSAFTAFQRAILTLLILSMIVLTIGFVFICRKNRRLEYKYTRLIESHTGELPAVETCGLDEDEDDDELQDRVIFSKGRKSAPSTNSRTTLRDHRENDNAAFISLDSED
uniref:Tyrosine-protein kinase ephrin type A/B receptor-like domain-containing protein n=1 Tax=Caenorhabditis japonica TaxID=281687 RepID=A0A8R1HZA5_CAEJA